VDFLGVTFLEVFFVSFFLGVAMRKFKG
jgi:hypothetical protein